MIQINQETIKVFCAKWKIVEFSIFGSALREDFRPESDVDVLVAFAPEVPWSLFDLAEMEEELKKLFGRDVDLIEKDAIKNPFRRHSILMDRKIFYAA